MPTYDYRCPNCQAIIEVFLPLADLNEPQKCSCDGTMKRTISGGHGGTHGDEAAWLRTMTLPLCRPKDEPITSRTQYNRIMKEKGLEHTD